MITGIGDLVDGAVNTIAGEVARVRAWSNANPCARQSFLQEHAGTVRPQVVTAQSAVAYLAAAGPGAIRAAITARGRASTSFPARYTGATRLAAWFVDDVLPVPDGQILATIFGGPIGAGLAREAWIDWIAGHLPSGRPSNSNTGTRVLGRFDVRISGEVLRGSAIRASYDRWIEHEWATVQPFGLSDWTARVAGLTAKVAGLEAKEADLLAEIDRYETLCNEQRELDNDRTDLLIGSEIEARRVKQGLIALAIAGIVYFGKGK